MFLFFLGAVIVCTQCEAGKVSKQNKDGSGLCPDHWIDATLSGLGCLFFNSSRDHIQDELDVTWLEAAYCIGANNQKTTLHWCRSTLRYSSTLSEACFWYSRTMKFSQTGGLVPQI